MGGFIQSSLTRAVRMISGPSEISDIEKLKEAEKLYQWEDQIIGIQKEKVIWRIEKKRLRKGAKNPIFHF